MASRNDRKLFRKEQQNFFLELTGKYDLFLCFEKHLNS